MTTWTYDIISLAAADTLDGLFRERVRRAPEAVAYIYFDKTRDAWCTITWEEMAARVARWQAALAQEQLRPGDRVAIMLRNGPEWVVFDQAALALGLVTVPLYTDDRPDNVAYILSDCAAKLVLLQDSACWRRLRDALAPLSGLQRIVLGGNTHEPLQDPRVVYEDAWLTGPHPPAPSHAHDPHSLASIVYTSGTTGRPKGVMLSHHNMLWNAHTTLMHGIKAYREDVFLSPLPLSHTLKRTCGYYMTMMSGSQVVFIRSILQLGDDMQATAPTFLICVPRVLERIAAKVWAQLEQRPWPVRLLFRFTLHVGWRRFQRTQGKAWFVPEAVLWPLLERRVAQPLCKRLGGRLRLVICGGAALPAAIARFYIGLGLTVLQGYGLTETSPVISVNTPEDNDPASVGTPLPGIEVRIGAQHELLTRSPSVMLGYWNNHSATHERIDTEGWLHTGDQARIDNRHLYLTGRLKDILVMSNGEKVPPADMEMAIGADPLFEQALIVGEGRPYLAALLVLNPERWTALAQQFQLNPADPTSLNHLGAQQAVLARVAKQLYAFPGYAKVRRAALLLEPWSIENDLLTPTLKIKRNKVIERYSDLINSLYSEPTASPGKAKS